MVLPPPVGEKSWRIAGHVWQVAEDVDHKRHLVYCSAGQGHRSPLTSDSAPGIMHTKILETNARGASGEEARIPI